MYTDVELNSYTYLFDSNYYLKYTNEMFWQFNSKVNNKGVAMILKNLMYYINYLDMYTQSSYDYINQSQVDTDNKYVPKHLKYSDQGTQTDPPISSESSNNLFRL